MKIKNLVLTAVLGVSSASLMGQLRNHMPVQVDNASYMGASTTPGISKSVQSTYYSVKLSDFAKNPTKYENSPTILRGVKVNFNTVNASCAQFTQLVALDVDLGTTQKYCFYMRKELYDNWKNKNQTTADIAFRGNTSGGYIIREIE